MLYNRKFEKLGYAIGFRIGMGTIPLPSIDTVDTYELEVSIDTSTKYR